VDKENFTFIVIIIIIIIILLLLLLLFTDILSPWGDAGVGDKMITSGFAYDGVDQTCG
jgi:hypothetical protein